MNYLELIELIADFAFIQVPEAIFIIFITMLFSKIKIRKNEFIASVLICSITSSFLLPFGYNDLFGRVVYLIIVGIIILSVNKLEIKRIINIYLGIFTSLLVMVVTGFIGFIPFLYLFGKDISILQESVFLMIVCSIPTRVFEYMACYLIHQRLGEKNEEINRKD